MFLNIFSHPFKNELKRMGFFMQKIELSIIEELQLNYNDIFQYLI